MKKYITTLLLLATVIFTACAQRRTSVKKRAKPVKTSASAITSVSMGRGACFGRCPIYTVIVHSNGLVQYKGRSFTEHIGVYEKKFTPQQTARILAECREYRIDTCSRTYELPIADLPGIYYKITMNGKVKEINNAHFGPEFLKDLARDIDAFAQVDASWTKVSTDVPD